MIDFSKYLKLIEMFNFLKKNFDHVKKRFSIAVTKSKKSSAKSVVIETIIFKVCAQLHELTIEFVTDQNAISLWAIKGITSEVIIKKPYTQIIAKLTDLIVKDLNPNSIHTKVIIYVICLKI